MSASATVQVASATRCARGHPGQVPVQVQHRRNGRCWPPPDLTGVEVIAQPHCHHRAVTGFDIDRALLEAAGARVTTLADCCGLAGNFGMERGHYEMSVAVADTSLLPALRAAPAERLAPGVD